MADSIFTDPQSRYRDENLRNDKYIWMTPRQLEEFDINFPFEEGWRRDRDWDDKYPILYDFLAELIKETTIGASNGCFLRIPVKDCKCYVYQCIEINGKLCKLQSEEWNAWGTWGNLPKSHQLKTFNRLLAMGQIKVEDLAVEDIDDNIYKHLVANSIDAEGIYRRKMKKLNDLYEADIKRRERNRKNRLREAEKRKQKQLEQNSKK